MYFLTIFLQADTEAKVTQNILDIITKGGPLGIAINVVLLILSILAVYIYLERYFTIQKAVKIDKSFMNNIRLPMKFF